MKGAEIMTEWVVKCMKCGHIFKTRSLVPSCGRCHLRSHVKWIKAVKE